MSSFRHLITISLILTVLPIPTFGQSTDNRSTAYNSCKSPTIAHLSFIPVGMNEYQSCIYQLIDNNNYSHGQIENITRLHYNRFDNSLLISSFNHHRPMYYRTYHYSNHSFDAYFTKCLFSPPTIANHCIFQSRLDSLFMQDTIKMPYINTFIAFNLKTIDKNEIGRDYIVSNIAYADNRLHYLLYDDNDNKLYYCSVNPASNNSEKNKYLLEEVIYNQYEKLGWLFNTQIVVSPDGKYLAYSVRRRIRIFNLQDKTFIAEKEFKGIPILLTIDTIGELNYHEILKTVDFYDLEGIDNYLFSFEYIGNDFSILKPNK